MSLVRKRKIPWESSQSTVLSLRRLMDDGMMGNFRPQTWKCFPGTYQGRKPPDEVNEAPMSSVSKPSYLLLRSLHACGSAVVTQLHWASRRWITQPVCLPPDNPPPLCCLGNASSLFLALISLGSYQTVNSGCARSAPGGVVEESPNPQDVCNVTPLTVFPRGAWLAALHGCLNFPSPIEWTTESRQ